MLHRMPPKMTSNSIQNRQKTERGKTKNKFLKELVENADLKKSVLNKIMNTHKECNIM